MKKKGTFLRTQAWRFTQYLRYLHAGRTIYDLHSPGLFRYLQFVTDPSRKYYGMARLRPLRDIIAREMQVTSGKYADPLVEELKRNSRPFKRRSRLQSSRKVIHCLFRSVVYLRSKSILHLGAGNGLDSLFLKIASGDDSRLFLDHQLPELQESSKRYFSWLGKTYEEMELDGSSIAITPPSHQVKFDLVVFGTAIDPTRIGYQLLDNLAEVCSTDATWLMLGPNMDPQRLNIWNTIKQHSFTNASIDCWSFGAAFGSPAFRTKINYTYTPWILKPWRIGLWSDSMATSQ